MGVMASICGTTCAHSSQTENGGANGGLGAGLALADLNMNHMFIGTICATAAVNRDEDNNNKNVDGDDEDDDDVVTDGNMTDNFGDKDAAKADKGKLEICFGSD